MTDPGLRGGPAAAPPTAVEPERSGISPASGAAAETLAPPGVDAAARAQAEGEVQTLTAAIETGQADADTYQLRASYLLELNRLDEAEADLEKVTASLQRDLLQADIASARGQLREAADLYEAVLAEHPDRTGAARKLARLYVQMESFRPDEIAFVRETLSRQMDRLAGTPDWVRWATFLHERYAAAGQWQEDLDLLGDVEARSPVGTNPRLGLWLVDALLALGRLDDAQAMIGRLSLSSKHPAALTAVRHTLREMIRASRTSSATPVAQQLAAASESPADATLASMLARAADGERFVPLARIGAGAAAEVWRAFDLLSGEEVGLKVLHESLREDETAQQELKREYEVMAGSLSPRLARTIPDTFSGDRFAMELLDGSLIDLLNEPANLRGLPVARAVVIAQQTAEGLDYLHARGLVYQDLSPQNILFRNGLVKLCDLGGAKFTAAGEDAGTATVAKVAYASPEQCSVLVGESGAEVDRRTDIYSLGVVLYQMLTGRLPFEGPDQAVLHAHLYSTPVAPLIHRPEIGRELNEIVLRAMARDPQNRYATAAALWDALKAAAPN